MKQSYFFMFRKLENNVTCFFCFTHCNVKQSIDLFDITSLCLFSKFLENVSTEHGRLSSTLKLFSFAATNLSNLSNYQDLASIKFDDLELYLHLEGIYADLYYTEHTFKPIISQREKMTNIQFCKQRVQFSFPVTKFRKFARIYNQDVQ